MSKERFKHVENDVVNYIDDDKTGIAYIATNYYDMKNLTELLNKQDQKIADLEAKLAEKEKEIEEWIAVRDDKNKVINKQTDKINKLKEELKAKETLNQIFKDNRENKISFAVEELEKVKEYIKTNLMSFQKVPIIQEINNQIKELKEME